MSRRSEYSANRDMAEGARKTPVSEESAMHEWHAEVSEYRLRHQDIKPELLREIERIGRAFR